MSIQLLDTHIKSRVTVNMKTLTQAEQRCAIEAQHINSTESAHRRRCVTEFNIALRLTYKLLCGRGAKLSYLPAKVPAVATQSKKDTKKKKAKGKTTNKAVGNKNGGG